MHWLEHTLWKLQKLVTFFSPPATCKGLEFLAVSCLILAETEVLAKEQKENWDIPLFTSFSTLLIRTWVKYKLFSRPERFFSSHCFCLKVFLCSTLQFIFVPVYPAEYPGVWGMSCAVGDPVRPVFRQSVLLSNSPQSTSDNCHLHQNVSFVRADVVPPQRGEWLVHTSISWKWKFHFIFQVLYRNLIIYDLHWLAGKLCQDRRRFIW